MYDPEICCSFTGHRPQKLPWRYNENDPRCKAMISELDTRLDGIYQAGYRHFFCGMAIGCDFYFAEAVLRLREKYPDVSLEAVVPCLSQSDKWYDSDRMRYKAILSHCDKVNVLQQQYTADCMQKRNRYMVDRSSLLLACFDGYPGGTMNTIAYAKRKGLSIIVIDPEDYK